MKHLTLKEQLKIERRKNEALQAKLLKNQSDVDYIAMMCDVELECEPSETPMTEEGVADYE
ncbi:MAG: hypothetical protein IKL29_06630 [Bacteroidaceae bacterium]|nr:hypothetical protein [Bacteroidaceae bacterium]